MRIECKYEVCTHWGRFRLDESAYRDYLTGGLWISWKPGVKALPETRPDAPASASRRALKLREEAAKNDAYTVCLLHFHDGSADVPYQEKMSDTGIGEMCLTVRSQNGLMRAGICTIGKLKAKLSEEKGLINVRNLGLKSEREIKIAFFNTCYSLLSEYDKALWWQKQLEDVR